MPNVAVAEARALHLLPHQGVGGLQRAVIDLVRHERMDGAQDEIVLTERPLDVDGDFMAPATPVHFLGLLGSRVAERGQRLADLADSRGARVIHAYTTGDLLVASAARRAQPRLRVLATPFDRPVRGSFLERRRLRSAVRSLDGLFAPSPALADTWRALGREPELRLAAVDVQRFSPQEAQSSWRAARLPHPDTLLIGSMMRAVPGKRHDVLIEAAEARHAAGRPTAVLLVGDGPRLAELKERARGSDVVHVRRRVLDAPGFFARTDALALHADHELVPIALLEALACGRPAIVADRGDVAQLIGDEAVTSGVVTTVAPGDVEATVAAFDALGDASRRAELGSTARRIAVERHALGRLRGQLAATYD
ncbi:MAG: glycosyltransferase family 4 protein [Planctomycetota bacterium]